MEELPSRLFSKRAWKGTLVILLIVATSIFGFILHGRSKPNAVEELVDIDIKEMVVFASVRTLDASSDAPQLLLVEEKIAAARNLLESGDVKNFFKNPYVVSALYYSDSFLKKSIREEEEKGPIRVVRAIRDLITPELREEYMRMLDGVVARSSFAESILRVPNSPVRPFNKIDFGRGEQDHADAIDLFIAEGTSVRAIQGGIVVLAESGWNQDDVFSTSSFKCGNSVIIYYPPMQSFFRYCHLKTVFVTSFDIIKRGTHIGSIGNSGKNAVRKGHGDHLHLEINQYDREQKKMISVSNRALREFITSSR